MYTPAFVFEAKSQMRLAATCDIARYYTIVGRDTSVAIIRCNPVIRNFKDQQKDLKNRRKDEEAKAPKISKVLPVTKWSEALTDFLHSAVEIRMIPLTYTVREIATPTRELQALLPDVTHSEDHSSIEEEILELSSRTHQLVRNYSARVYYHLEEATRGNHYASLIKLYQHSKNGRDTWLAIGNTYSR